MHVVRDGVKDLEDLLAVDLPGLGVNHELEIRVRGLLGDLGDGLDVKAPLLGLTRVRLLR